MRLQKEVITLLCALCFPLSAQFVQQGAKLAGTPKVANDNQGSCVALSSDGNTAIAGGLGDGSTRPAGAWVFTRTGGVWSQQGAKLVPNNPLAESGFGGCVAISADGKTAVISDPTDNHETGAVWVFTFDGTNWTQQSKLVAPGPIGEQDQGYSVAVSSDGNTVVAGAPSSNNYFGLVWVYTRTGTTWSTPTILLSTSAGTNSSQGYSIAISGDGTTLMFGAPGDGASAGSAWAFTHSGSGWTPVGGSIAPNDATTMPEFGAAVALSNNGTTAFVGGPGDGTGAHAGAGAVWVFTLVNGAWTQQGPKLVASDSGAQSNLGHSVSVSGDGNTLVAGGPFDSSNAGAAWVFTYSGTAWSQLGNKLVGTLATGTATQGSSVAISSDASTIMVGGPRDANGVGAEWMYSQPVTASPISLSPNPVILTAAVNATTAQTLTIMNNGATPLTITSYTFGSNSAFGYNPVCYVTIQPGLNCKQPVTFSPTSWGSVRDSFVIHDYYNVATPLQQTVMLTGNGLGPAVSLDTSTLSVPSPAGALVPTVTLKNTGNADLHNIIVTVNGNLTGFSKINDTCFGATIPSQNTCHLQFSFTPPSPPATPWQTTTVTITDDASPGTQTITLLSVISGAAIFYSPASPIPFSTNVTQQISQNITLTNIDNVAIQIANTQLGLNAFTQGFSIPNLPCIGQTLSAALPGQAGGTCTFAVNFKPPLTGNFPNAIAITTTPALPATTITLAGKSAAFVPKPILPNHIPVVPDPVDSSTGQFYDQTVDFALGGPMGFGFTRYYSSALAAIGPASGLGVKWMSNFDVGLVVSGPAAQALLFGGQVVTFAGSGASWQLVSPLDPQYQLVQSGAVFNLMDPSSSLIYSFSAAGIITTIQDRKGNAITITSGPFGPTAATDGLGRTLAFTYTNGNLTSIADQAGRTVTFTYNSNLLASSTDIYKQTTNYTYTSAGSLNALMSQKQLPLGNVPTTQAYDASGRVISQTDPNNNVTKIAYDGNGGTTATDASGNVTKQGNDSNGDLTQLTDPDGASDSLTFDSNNRRTSFTDKVGNRTTYTYDQASGNLASVTDALGNTTSYTYASQTQGGFTFYNLSNISYPDGTSSNYTYDSNGSLLSLTARDGTTTSYAYDSSGRITSVTGANGKVSTNTWNADGTMATTTDPLGNQTSFAYDNLKRLTQTTDPNGGKTSYVYDQSATGPMVATTLPAGGSQTIYDDPNRQARDEANATGGIFHSDYTATGKLSAITDPVKNKTNYFYDVDDRFSSVTSPAGEAVSYTYEAANRVVSVTDANGPRISYTYTSEGNIATSTDGSGNKSSYTYDALGRLATITTPGGNKYATAYDKLGAVIGNTNPLGEVQALARDAAGRVVSVTLPGPIATTLKRDAAGSVNSITSPNGNAWTIAYDALERPSKFTDPLGQAISLTYSGTLLSGVTLPLGTVAITSDLNGKVTKRQYSDGTAINTAYDANGQLSSADGVTVTRDIKGQPTNINGIGITLDPASRPGALTYAAGKTIAYTYDKGGRLASVADWVGGKTTLAYDGASRLASLTYPNGVANTFTYDTDGRLTNIAVGSIASIALVRDAAGKITSANRSLPRLPSLQSGAQQLTYDAAGQLTSATSDAMGRVTAQNGRNYTWNLASQLTSFADGVNSAAFSYDGLGEISSSTFSGAAQTFVYNYLFQYPALSIVRQGGTDLRYYVYLPDGTLLYSIEAANNSRRFYHFDEMGNTVLLTDDAGGVPDSYAITPYGDIADHLGATANPFTWQGQYGVIQEGQGLYYIRSRHYDASAGRFISRDPALSVDPLSSEPYVFAGGNPLRFIDPLGTDFVLPSGISTLPPDQAVNYANALALSIGRFVFGLGATLPAEVINDFSAAETAIQAQPGLNWLKWTADSQWSAFITPNFFYQPPTCAKPPCSGAPGSPSGQPPAAAPGSGGQSPSGPVPSGPPLWTPPLPPTGPIPSLPPGPVPSLPPGPIVLPVLPPAPKGLPPGIPNCAENPFQQINGIYVCGAR